MKTTNSEIDIALIKKPVVTFTERAYQELKLIIENDFTLAGKYFRILISGKGCDGFTYSAGFTDFAEDDFLIKINDESIKTHSPDDLYIIIDPFAAFYLSDVSVDFVLDPVHDIEGFIITNNHQKEFHGKFWKQDMSKTPPMKMKNLVDDHRSMNIQGNL